MDVGNLLLAALVLGQVVSTTKNIGIMIVGAAGFCLTYVIGISIMATKARRKK